MAQAIARSSMDDFESFMADLKTKSEVKRAALAAWWFIENVTEEDPARTAIYFLVRQYMEMVR